MTTAGLQTRLGFAPDRLERITDWMQSYVDDGRYPGASVLIARGGNVAFRSQVGQRDIEAGKPFEQDTIARIYSMTKPLTSVAIMMLVERGLFTLNTPISEFIPEFAKCRALLPGAQNLSQSEPAPTPTVHQLLVHTAGFSYSFNEGLMGEAYLENQIHFGTGPVEPGLTLETAAKRVAELPLAFQPGSKWEYSIAIDLLGRIIEVASGEPLDQFLHNHIIEPLGMVDTAFDVPEDKLDRFAACYTCSEDKSTLMALSDAPQTTRYKRGTVTAFSGGGGLVSTLDDYLKFADMVRRGGERDGVRFLSPRTLDFMRQNHLKGDIASMGPTSFAEMPMDGTGFGLGWSVVIDPAQVKVPGSMGDYGWGGLASTGWWNDPVQDITTIFFTQLIPSSAWPSRPQLRALVNAAVVGDGNYA
ncbi:serine hydrolase domain-containing protein [Pseudahrensia aquimaris]|uniref:Serine hydrolase domain-containing protein n=1 Tax=Pseudahrensia aquimaris TaxID=744461 RepID=A0ABW3FGP1_9HYPH